MLANRIRTFPIVGASSRRPPVEAIRRSARRRYLQWVECADAGICHMDLSTVPLRSNRRSATTDLRAGGQDLATSLRCVERPRTDFVLDRTVSTGDSSRVSVGA